MCCLKPVAARRMGVGSQKMCQFWEVGRIEGEWQEVSVPAGSPLLSLVCGEGSRGISFPASTRLSLFAGSHRHQGNGAGIPPIEVS